MQTQEKKTHTTKQSKKTAESEKEQKYEDISEGKRYLFITKYMI